MPEKIEKPWVVYPYTVQNLAAGIARIVKINPSGSLDIEYVERQRYPERCLDSDCLGRFDSSTKAIDYILENGFKQNTCEELVEILELNFPEALKQEREQSRPKCTEPEFQTSLDRDALATLGQPMYDWRFKPTAFE
ncbi:MAG: hypothetical protein Q7S06_00910 [Nanoarchaeota archaeon]|nr:hypothetical protein [Nanoarchaeota archaeon]